MTAERRDREAPLFESTQNTRWVIDGSHRFLRSDVPTAVSEEERLRLLSLGVTAVFDLRTERERREKPCPLADDARFAYHAVPLAGGDRVPPTPEDVPRSYIAMADAEFDRLIERLLAAKTGVLYFCNAGKDRTGVVTAALLHRLGFPTSYIVADYMRSGVALRQALFEFAEHDPTVDIRVITPSEQYILAFLEWYGAR